MAEFSPLLADIQVRVCRCCNCAVVHCPTCGMGRRTPPLEIDAKISTTCYCSPGVETQIAVYAVSYQPNTKNLSDDLNRLNRCLAKLAARLQLKGYAPEPKAKPKPQITERMLQQRRKLPESWGWPAVPVGVTPEQIEEAFEAYYEEPPTRNDVGVAVYTKREMYNAIWKLAGIDGAKPEPHGWWES